MADSAVQRVNMVDSQVRPSDVTDRRIIRAMLDVPREAFVPAPMRSIAYLDGDVPLGPPSRVLLAPRLLAKMLQLVALGDADTVMVCGCGTGYSAAVLSRIAERVVAVESNLDLRAVATKELKNPAYQNVQLVQGRLSDGYPTGGPYDAIFVEGAISQAPGDLLGQLKDGGRLIAILVSEMGSRATLWRRNGRAFGESSNFDATAPLIPEFSRHASFVL